MAEECDICKESFLSVWQAKEHFVSLVHHINLSRSRPGALHKCDTCAFACTTVGEYSKHIDTIVHKDKLAVLLKRQAGVREDFDFDAVASEEAPRSGLFTRGLDADVTDNSCESRQEKPELIFRRGCRTRTSMVHRSSRTSDDESEDSSEGEPEPCFMRSCDLRPFRRMDIRRASMPLPPSLFQDREEQEVYGEADVQGEKRLKRGFFARLSKKVKTTFSRTSHKEKRDAEKRYKLLAKKFSKEGQEGGNAKSQLAASTIGAVCWTNKEIDTQKFCGGAGPSARTVLSSSCEAGADEAKNVVYENTVEQFRNVQLKPALKRNPERKYRVASTKGRQLFSRSMPFRLSRHGHAKQCIAPLEKRGIPACSEPPCKGTVHTDEVLSSRNKPFEAAFARPGSSAAPFTSSHKPSVKFLLPAPELPSCDSTLLQNPLATSTPSERKSNVLGMEQNEQFEPEVSSAASHTVVSDGLISSLYSPSAGTPPLCERNISPVVSVGSYSSGRGTEIVETDSVDGNETLNLSSATGDPRLSQQNAKEHPPTTSSGGLSSQQLLIEKQKLEKMWLLVAEEKLLKASLNNVSEKLGRMQAEVLAQKANHQSIEDRIREIEQQRDRLLGD